MAEEKICLICGTRSTEAQNLLFVKGQLGCICEDCISNCTEVIDKYHNEEEDIIDNREEVKTPQKTSSYKKPEEIVAFLNQYVVGQDRAKRKLANAVHNHYKMLDYNKTKKESDVEIHKSNVLLLGPTGSGKTYLLDTISKFLDVPFATADATGLTEAGYVGDDVENVIRILLENANYDIEKAERGIIYIDEIDKLTRKSENMSTTRDVGGEGVQQAILKMIEGTIVETPMTKGRKHPGAECVKVNTRNILFIVGGSFEGIEKIVEKRLNKNGASGIGFGSTVKSKKDVTMNDIVDDITVEDLKKFGMIPEFLGRVPVLASLRELDREALIKILVEPKDALIKQYQKLFAMDDVVLEFEQDALNEIADLALARRTGARALRGIMEETLEDIMFTVPSDETIKKVIITKDTVKKQGQPIIERHEEVCS